VLAPVARHLAFGASRYRPFPPARTRSTRPARFRRRRNNMSRHRCQGAVNWVSDGWDGQAIRCWVERMTLQDIRRNKASNKALDEGKTGICTDDEMHWIQYNIGFRHFDLSQTVQGRAFTDVRIQVWWVTHGPIPKYVLPSSHVNFVYLTGYLQALCRDRFTKMQFSNKGSSFITRVPSGPGDY